MKILTLDIETSPNLADVWDLWNQTVSLNQLRESSRVLCWAAKWRDSKTVNFGAEWSHDNFIEDIHDIISAADVVQTYNGDRFDLPTLNREFLVAGLGPPEPYISVDLYKVVKQKFKFASAKLDYVCQQLKIGGKVKHTGHQLWVDVINGDPKAQKLMEKYNKNDTVITEKLGDRVLPWNPAYPNRLLFDSALCVRCESGLLTKRGFYYASTGKYQTYRCGNCGGYQRDVRRLDSTTQRGV